MSDTSPLSAVRLLSHCPLCECGLSRVIKTERNVFPKGVHPEVFVFTGTWTTLVKCSDCSFAYVQEIPTSPTFFRNRYDNSWFDPEHEVASFRKTQILEELFEALKKIGITGGKLLDVGSFAGKLLYFSKQQGFEPEGIEINPKLAKFCQDRLGFKVYSGEFQSATLPSDHYEVITIIDVLEHLVGPKEVFRTMQRALAPGGVIYIKVPNYPMQIFKQDVANLIGVSDIGMCANFAHINHFNVRSMRRLFEDHGLELVRVQIARSEHWGSDKRFWRLRNLVRDLAWKASSLIHSLGGPCLGLNVIYIGKKAS